jgi:hypothetical protein
MLLTNILSEFATAPVGFIASGVTILSFVLGTVLTLVPSPNIAIGSWKIAISPTHARLLAAILWALSLSLGAGVVAGKVYSLHWLAGVFALPIAAFVTGISIGSISGQFANAWIQEIATVRKSAGQSDEWFIGITPLITFTELCSSGIAWLVISALALGFAEPWVRSLIALDGANPNQGIGVVLGGASLIAASIAVFYGKSTLIGAVTTAFTAQAGIRWADAVPVMQRPPPPPPVPPTPTPARATAPTTRPRRSRTSSKKAPSAARKAE